MHGEKHNAASFREELPHACPPPDAEMGAWTGVYRMLPSATPCDDDFLSHQAKGKVPPPGVDPCRWAACSLFTTKEKALAIAKLPTMKNTISHLARIDLPLNSGISKKKMNISTFGCFPHSNLYRPT